MSQIIFEKDLSRHPLHYFILLCIQLIGLWGVFWFSYLPQAQFVIIITMAVGYLLWGVFHHYEHHDLHIKIIWEYLLVATLAILLFGSLLIRT